MKDLTQGNKTNRNIPIQQYYVRKLVVYFFVPLLFIFIIGLCMVYHQINIEKKNQLLIAQNTIVETLDREISSFASIFAHFNIVNNKENLQLVTEYGNNQLNANAYIELMDNFNTLLAIDRQIVSLDYFMENHQRISLDQVQLSLSDEVFESAWYTNALENKNIVNVDIISNEYYTSPERVTANNLLLFILGANGMNAQAQVEVVTMGVKSDAIDLIESSVSWTNGIQTYLLDEDGEVLVSSTNQYDDVIEEMSCEEGLYGNITYSVTTIEKTQWKLISISEGNFIEELYWEIMGFIIISIMFLVLMAYILADSLSTDIIKPIQILTDNFRVKNGRIEKGAIQEHKILEVSELQEKYDSMLLQIQGLMTENINQERERHKQELKSLQSQINPHFLSNALGSIRFMAQLAKVDGIKKMTESLINMLNVSFRDIQSFHSLEMEMTLVYSYVEIMLISRANSFEIEYEIEKDCLVYPVPKLIVQPFIENAITHAFDQSEDIGLIKLRVNLEGNIVVFEIWDNGQGMTAQQIEELKYRRPDTGKSIGLANINTRLKLYYGEEYSIHIESEIGEYTVIQFKVPIS